jgi:segregation and condensation protein B
VSTDKIKSIIEALLFAGSEPLKPSEIREVISPAVQLTEGEIRAMIDKLREEYRSSSRSFTIAEVAGGYRLQTLPEYAEWIGKLRAAPSKRKLSAPALETLAIVAYRQPITKAEIEAIRGVNIDGVLENLADRELVETRGRKQAVGKPHLYVTTRKFLEHFGLRDLKDLPQIEELKRATVEKTSPVAADEKAPATEAVEEASAEAASEKDPPATAAERKPSEAEVEQAPAEASNAAQPVAEQKELV